MLSTISASPIRLALTPKDAAEALGLSVTALCRDRTNGGLGGIPFVRLGGKVVYPVRDLQEFLSEIAQRAQAPQVAAAPVESGPAVVAAPVVKRGRGRPRKLAQQSNK